MTSSTTISLSGGGSGLFYSDSVCSATTATSTVSTSTSVATFYFKDTKAETLTLAASSGSLTTGTLTLTVSAASAASISFTGPTAATAGACGSAFTTTLLDASGNLSGVSSATVVTVSGSGAAILYSASNCTGALTALTLSSGSNASSFYLLDTAAEALTLSASTSSLTSSAITYVVSPATATRFTLTGPTSSTAGTAVTVTIKALDTYGNTVTSYGSDVTVGTTGSATGGGLADIVSGAATKSIGDNVAETVTVSLSDTQSTGLTLPSNLSVTFAAGTAARLAVQIPPSVSSPYETDVCFQVTVNSQDAYGNISPVGADLGVNLLGGGKGIFYSDNICGSPIANFVLGSGTNLFIANYRNATIQTVTLDASSSGYSSTPVTLTTASNREIVSSYMHSCALTDANGVKCWGENSKGKLGQGDTINRGDGANEMGNCLPTMNLGTGRTAVRLALGDNHSCAILDTGDLRCWGGGISGKLLTGTSTDMGDNPVRIGDNFDPSLIGTNLTARKITAANNHACAVLSNSGVKCWGNGSGGRLGYGDVNNKGGAATSSGDSLAFVDLGTARTARGVQAGGQFSCAVTDALRVKCWGDNLNGQLGQGDTVGRGDEVNEMGNNLANIDLGTNRTVSQLSCGFSFCCAILDNKTAKCWGNGANGRLGNQASVDIGDGASEMGDNLPAINLGTNRTPKTIKAGKTHVCAQLDTNQLKCWGTSASGSLGYGDTIDRGDGANEMGDNLPAVDLGINRTVKRVTAGDVFTCALLDDYTVKCWGIAGVGQTGQGDTITRGDGANEMGGNLPTIGL